MSCPWGHRSRSLRRISRTRRRIRFRSWALPSLRGVVRPNRVISPPFGRTKTTNDRDAFRLPPLYTARNWRGSRSLQPLGNVARTRRSGLRSVVFNGQPPAPFGAPSLQDQAPRLRPHPLAKPVLLRAPPVVGLKGPCWHRLLYSIKNDQFTTRRERRSSYVSDIQPLTSSHTPSPRVNLSRRSAC